LACCSPFWMWPCPVWGGLQYWLHTMSWAAFIPFLFVRKIKEGLVLAFLWRSCRIQLRICQGLDSSFMESLYCCLNFISKHRSV
jgi:hypothetical protein